MKTSIAERVSRLNRNTLYKLGLSAIFLFALFLRFFRLAEIPDVVHIDEMALGYNAWCLAHYGVDRYLNVMPIYIENFNGGQSPLYTYIVVLLLTVFGKGGLPIFLVRIPGAVSSMIVVIFGTKSIAHIFRSRKLTLLSATLLAVLPYYLMHGRFALDCNLMLGCCTFAVYQLIMYIQSGKLSRLIVCGISFGIVLYSYALSYSIIALFLILISLYLLYTRKITFSRVFIWAFAVCITALPILIFIACLLFDLPPQHFLGFTISPIASERAEEFYTSEFVDNIWRVVRLSFTNGLYPLDAVDKYYTMYPVSIPFIVIGFFISAYHFIVSVIKRTFHFSSVYFLFYICGLITMGFVGGVFIYRSNYFFVSYIYFLISGILGVCSFLKRYRRIFTGALLFVYLLWNLAFLRYYYAMYTVLDFTPHTDYLYYAHAKEPVTFVESELQSLEIHCDFKGCGVFYHFNSPVSPYEWTENGTPDDGNWRNRYCTVDYTTPVAAGNAYIIRKENSEFINRLNQSGQPYDMWEFDYYYVFYCK